MTQNTIRITRTRDYVPRVSSDETAIVPIKTRTRAIVRARLFALSMLTIVVVAFGSAAFSAYRAATDSYVAPLTLSADNDLVVTSRLQLDQLSHERARAAADLQGIEAQLTADEDSLRRLREIRGRFQRAVDWFSRTNAQRARFGAAEIDALNEQTRLGQSMLNEQLALTRQAEADVHAGLITRTDYARETQRLGELRQGIFDHRRFLIQGQAAMQEVKLMSRSLKEPSAAPLGPELLGSEEQLLRVDLETLRLQADVQAKAAVRLAHLDRFAKLDSLIEQLMKRPVYRAIEQKLDLAFVPYTQLPGVAPGDVVYMCTWGLFFCQTVGRVSEILDGEISTVDPWGAPARGQYAVLKLRVREALHGKTLRVRRLDAGSAAAKSHGSAAAAPRSSLIEPH